MGVCLLSGEVKIADFGLSKDCLRDKCWTPNDVVTLWYRPPEILFQVPQHTTAVDMWYAVILQLTYI